MKTSSEVLRLSEDYEARGMRSQTSLRGANAMTISEALKKVGEILSGFEATSQSRTSKDASAIVQKEQAQREIDKFLTDFATNVDNSKSTHRLMNTVRDLIELYRQ